MDKSNEYIISEYKRLLQIYIALSPKKQKRDKAAVNWILDALWRKAHVNSDIPLIDQMIELERSD